MRFASLFSGIGGFELGLSDSGFVPSLLCDIDPVAQHVLKSRFPDAPIEGDIRNIERLPAGTDLVTAGFPCQDLSSVGQKNGIGGTRSGLIGEVYRILQVSKPEWIIIENVYFMLHLNKGAGIKNIVAALEDLGYSWAYRVLDSLGFGLPQRRRRVFIVASRSGDPRNVLLSDSGTLKPGIPSVDRPIGFYWTEGTYATGLAADSVPPLKGGSTIGIPSPPAVLMPSGLVGMPHIEDAEAIQGFPRNWTKNAMEVSRPGFRWRLVGNAVPVNVAQWLGKQLANPGGYDSSCDMKLDEGHTWPDAAWGQGGKRFRSNALHHPAGAKLPSLDACLARELKPLSIRATAGFLSRAGKGRLRFPEGFLCSIERHLAVAA
jgi:DNA (cytosine-5)-methyltransferase 1